MGDNCRFRETACIFALLGIAFSVDMPFGVGLRKVFRQIGYNERMAYVYFLTFVTGLVSLAVELAASRLLGAYFGSSNLVWATIIGLILLYLTMGYFLGGRWADREPRLETLYRLAAWAGLTVALVPVAARPVLYRAAAAFDTFQLGVLLGAFVAVVVLLIVPVTLLGMVSPFVIRIATKRTAEAGRVAGRVYAISTLGSFVGAFLPDLLLVPWIGTRRTFLLLGLVLTFTAWGGLWLRARRRAWRYAWMPLTIVLLWLFWASGPIKQTPDMIYETESAYNYIQVLEIDGYRLLRLNEGQGVHSVYHPERTAYYGTWMTFLAGPFFNTPPFAPEKVRRVAVVGLAAGTVARQATLAFGPVPIDGYEIDPKILEVGRRYFGMGELTNLHAYAEDGRVGLRHSPYQYDLIVLDAYRPPYIPWHLTTREFFQLVSQHLTPQGVVAVNVGASGDDFRLANALAATLHTVFPSVYAVRVPQTFNVILYATAQPTKFENLEANMTYLAQQEAASPLLLKALQMAAREQVFLNMDAGEVFTDDRAPVALLTDRMVLRFVMSGDDSWHDGDTP